MFWRELLGIVASNREKLKSTLNAQPDTLKSSVNGDSSLGRIPQGEKRTEYTNSVKGHHPYNHRYRSSIQSTILRY